MDVTSIVTGMRDASVVHRTVSLGDLHVGKDYPMSAIKRVHTRYGEGVSAILTLDSGEKVEVYLPKRTSNYLTEEYITKLNGGPPLVLIYLGKVGKCNHVTFKAL